MDLSKLPRLSGTDTPPPAPPPQIPAVPFQLPPSQFAHTSAPQPVRRSDYVLGPELWLSLIVGLILVGISRHFPAYLFDRMTGHTYHTGIFFVEDGNMTTNEVPYPQLEGFVMLTDVAIFAFGISLLFDGILRALCMVLGSLARRLVMELALCLTLCATLFNAYAAIKLLHADIMPLISGMAVAFGGYMAFEQVRTVKLLK